MADSNPVAPRRMLNPAALGATRDNPIPLPTLVVVAGAAVEPVARPGE